MVEDSNLSRWRDPTWRERVARWTAERMTASGAPAIGPSTVVYRGPLAAVLRTPSASGDRYTKCAIPLYATEARVTKAIASGTPDWVPRVIDIEPSEGWLLMEDFGSRTLGDEPDTEWAEGLALHARLQQAWTGRVIELEAAGVERRPLRRLTDALPGLLDLGGLRERVDPSVRRTWPVFVERFQSAGLELEAVGLPETIVHGDLHPWNIAKNASGLCIFDWSDTAVGSPFLDVAVYLGRARRVARPRILDGYLEAWSEIAPRATLERAATLAMPLGALHQVLTYQRIAAAVAPGETSEFEGADAGWLQNAVGALDAGLEARFSFGPDGSPD